MGSVVQIAAFGPNAAADRRGHGIGDMFVGYVAVARDQARGAIQTRYGSGLEIVALASRVQRGGRGFRGALGSVVSDAAVGIGCVADGLQVVMRESGGDRVGGAYDYVTS